MCKVKKVSDYGLRPLKRSVLDTFDAFYVLGRHKSNIACHIHFPLYDLTQGTAAMHKNFQYAHTQDPS